MNLKVPSMSYSDALRIEACGAGNSMYPQKNSYKSFMNELKLSPDPNVVSDKIYRFTTRG